MEVIPSDDYGCNSLDEQAAVAQKANRRGNDECGVGGSNERERERERGGDEVVRSSRACICFALTFPRWTFLDGRTGAEKGLEEINVEESVMTIPRCFR